MARAWIELAGEQAGWGPARVRMAGLGRAGYVCEVLAGSGPLVVVLTGFPGGYRGGWHAGHRRTGPGNRRYFRVRGDGWLALGGAGTGRAQLTEASGDRRGRLAQPRLGARRQLRAIPLSRCHRPEPRYPSRDAASACPLPGGSVRSSVLQGMRKFPVQFRTGSNLVTAVPP